MGQEIQVLNFLLKGLIIGFCIAAPVGPISVLCINRSLREGFKIGFICGCGATTIDAIYGSIAGFGLTFISSFFIRQHFWIHLIGAVFLFYLGIKIFLTKPANKAVPVSHSKKLIHAYFSTLFLAATNPMTIISFAAVCAGLGLGTIHASYWASGTLVLGITLGAFSWWTLLSFTVSKLFHHRINEVWLQCFIAAKPFEQIKINKKDVYSIKKSVIAFCPPGYQRNSFGQSLLAIE